jgi:hypothetical protein
VFEAKVKLEAQGLVDAMVIVAQEESLQALKESITYKHTV